jgi:hypothetical protein
VFNEVFDLKPTSELRFDVQCSMLDVNLVPDRQDAARNAQDILNPARKACSGAGLRPFSKTSNFEFWRLVPAPPD